jgi:hypothetical protein
MNINEIYNEIDVILQCIIFILQDGYSRDIDKIFQIINELKDYLHESVQLQLFDDADNIIDTIIITVQSLLISNNNVQIQDSLQRLIYYKKKLKRGF